MSASMEKIVVQSDWNEALREEDGKAWISYKCQGTTTVHSELKTAGLSGEGIPYVSSDDHFSVNSVTQKTIDITYTKDGSSCTRRFISPLSTFTNIHTQRKTVYCVDVTAGGLGVSTDSEGQLKVWETETGDVRRLLDGHYGDVYTCRYFPSGVVILTGGADMQLKIWSAETGQCAATLKGHRAGILDTAVVDRGRNILSCSRDGTVRLWDCGTQASLGVFDECGGIVNSCALGVAADGFDLGTAHRVVDDREVGSQDKLLVLAGENKTLQGYGLHSRQKIFELPCHDAVNCCCFLSGTHVVCGTQDGHVTVCDIRNVRVPLKEWKEERNAILTLLPVNNGFLAGTGDGSCFFVDQYQDTRLELSGSDCDPIYKVSHDGKYVYTSCRDSCIRKYDIRYFDLL